MTDKDNWFNGIQQYVSVNEVTCNYVVIRFTLLE